MITSFTDEQKRKAIKFLDSFKFDKEHYEHSYRQWNKGGRGWDTLRLGGYYQMKTLMRYHHLYMGNTSKEWRPSIILKALLKESEAYLQMYAENK